ncbi:uncharacterized protein PFL1_03586 [Pseudozyma flocculosa PF-1]|uniref:PEBP-like protein n=1 Tax=Pseudozyma flocculosa PF-1 TaxID=1277687 RepID=A0A061H808_9BASI|nr:uncharacterized protein PFL1_03586 [Pseudozyma flocculosa PF-1]EPQ28783.1 hypothetical protein PFL1_03586 [Pseudozyma flocculosa PF-1]
MTFARASLALLALAGLARAQSDDASYEQVATIQENFPAALITPTYFPDSWFDIQGVLNVSFGGVSVGNIGDRLNLDQVQTSPTYRISTETKHADDADTFDGERRFTVAFLDTFVAGKDFGGKVNIHGLGNDYAVGDNGSLTNRSINAVPYAAPNPPANDGPHRYVQLVIQQFPNFTAPELGFTGAVGVNQSFVDYYNNAKGGLGKVVAANYIQIEVGQAAAPATTAAPAPSAVSSLAAQKSAAASTSGTSSGSSAKPSSTGAGSGSGSGTSGAMSVGAAPLAAMAGMGAAAILGALLL